MFGAISKLNQVAGIIGAENFDCTQIMYAEVDVFISNYTLVDADIYQLWTEGYSCEYSEAHRNRFVSAHLPEFVYVLPYSSSVATEAVHFQNTKGVARNMGAPLELVASDVLDHYRTYSLLERLLFAPTKLSEQPSFQLEPLSQHLLIEKYYNLDDTVAREILGKKLSSRYRKDLDEVADRTGIRLKSCRRQFDNVKRIFKCVEELPGNVTNNIKQNFLLPDELARCEQLPACILPDI